MSENSDRLLRCGAAGRSNHLRGAGLAPAHPLPGELSCAREETERLTRDSPDALLELDVAAHRRDVNALLLRTSELVRADAAGPKRDRRGADLVGADLGAADFTGADVRGADLGGADLTESIFLTQSQLDAANGDMDTRLPPSLTRPTQWLPSGQRQK
ncbi:MAG: pentapeptide repeat-containing protein [Pseudonocardiaceae bacterium]